MWQGAVDRDDLDDREQRRANYALQDMGEDAFVAVVTEGQPARPRYLAFDARANREPHALLDEHPPARLGLDDVLARRDAGAALIGRLS